MPSTSKPTVHDVPHTGRRDSSGIRLHYTPSLRRYDAGIMELGLVYTPVMAIPPKQHTFFLSGYCTSKCTQTVCIQKTPLFTALFMVQMLRMLGECFSWRAEHLEVLVLKTQTSWFDLRQCVFLSLCPIVFLGFASRRNLYIRVPAAHPLGGPWGEDGFGEGRQRAWGGTGGPAL